MLRKQLKHNQRIWHLGHNITFSNLYSKSISFSSSILCTEKKQNKQVIPTAFPLNILLLSVEKIHGNLIFQLLNKFLLKPTM